MTIIKTKDFVLRPIRMFDAKAYWEIMQDKETKKGFMSVPKNFQEAKKEVKELVSKNKRKVSEVFAIVVNKEYAGSVVLEYQNWNRKSDEGRMHIWLHPKFRGRGIATKAIKTVLTYGFKKKEFEKIYAQCKASNKAVMKVMEKCGFKKVKIHKVERIKKNLWVKLK